MKNHKLRQIAVVGLGLMGSSIIVSFLNAGYQVVALTPLPEELEIGSERIQDQLQSCHAMGLMRHSVSSCMGALLVTADYADMKYCDLVVECVIEIEEIKAKVYRAIERVVAPTAVIASNTSAIPISRLQQYLKVPSRFLGIHWAEPAFATRFLEITCGEHSDPRVAEAIQAEAESWEKEPTLLYKDIRGFITNRLMYAVYREGFHLINTNVASMAALDKCFQYDIGSWISMMGLFKRMDYLGLEPFVKMYTSIFPKLSTAKDVPLQMQAIAESEGRGIHNLDGLYAHDEASAKELDQSFALFNEEIYHLIEAYREKKKKLSL